jgi:hypothetical protein
VSVCCMYLFTCFTSAGKDKWLAPRRTQTFGASLPRFLPRSESISMRLRLMLKNGFWSRILAPDTKDGRPRDAILRLGSSHTPSRMIPFMSLLRCCRTTYNEGRAALLNCTHVVFSNRRQVRIWSQWRDCDYTHFVRI